MSTLDGGERPIRRTFATAVTGLYDAIRFRHLSPLSNIWKAISGRLVLERPPSKYGDVSRHDRLLGPPVPADMDEVRNPEYTNGSAVFVTTKRNEVKGGRTGSHR